MDEPIERIINKQMAKCLCNVEVIHPEISHKAKNVIKAGIRWTAEDVVFEISGNIKKEGLRE